MTHYHITHFVPTERHHGLYGYNEVIESLTYGLSALGHTVSYAKNKLLDDAKHIIFGVQMLDWDGLRRLPKGSIIYNLEQYYKYVESGYGKEIFEYLSQNFEIWDYSRRNYSLWEQYYSEFPVSIVPVGYAPTLSRISKAETQDIDILFYGSLCPERVEILRALCDAGLRVMFLYGFYGQDRDALIARSKIVMNIGERDRNFEIVRVSYLMANRKVVVSNMHPGIEIEPDVLQGIVQVDFDKVVETCSMLTQSDHARALLEERAFQTIYKRDIVGILEAALTGKLAVG
jgi:hypothetical protein